MFAVEPKVAILLATFNGARHIEEQLQSIRNQSYKNWELIVSDDGSDDDTVNIVRRFAREVRQPVLIINGPRRGFWQNFLTLLKRDELPNSKNALFAFCDQDDVWLQDKLARAVEWFLQQPSSVPSLYFSRTQLIDENGVIIGLSPLFKRSASFQNALVQSIGGGNTIILNLSARELVVRSSADIAIVSHDWWAYQIVTGVEGKAFYDPIPTLNYRQHVKNLVGANRGIKARLLRSLAFAGGRMRKWNEINTAALWRVRPILSDESKKTLDLFLAARASRAPKRVFLLWKSGVYRQGYWETFGLFVGASLGLI
ncbi:glycosyltransferase family 2 protein [Bradyrhizobium liaoningense]|uniref:glycosyltransferase family 2 protein n=1 Tax=Bradyrhizobium liaoningense TaxID=43992 RepID=UPI001BA55E33|nr:glycosyltransferase family 2 protein [Bradyrhizobium liaoningense]MBR0904600.1 glycosyltransferase family 2 protein [Bradyrhizobium liaoningense]